MRAQLVLTAGLHCKQQFEPASGEEGLKFKQQFEPLFEARSS